MTLLGLDFDNTLVRYDKLFYQIAQEKGLIDESVSANKTAVRDYLRNLGMDEEFTLMQGEVYGSRILEAEPAEGMLETLMELKDRGIDMVLISHKTKKPYKGPAYNLHEAAWTWLENYGFFSNNLLGWNKSQVHFEETKSSKIKKIGELRCTYYIDDLPEIIESISGSTKGLLYDPMNTYAGSNLKRVTEWKDIKDLLKETR